LARVTYSAAERRERHREAGRRYRERNPDLARAATRRSMRTAREREDGYAYNLAYYHSLTLAEYDELIERAAGRCQICDTDSPGGTGRWHIDHDHACCPGKRHCKRCIRGILCSRCNTHLGWYEAHGAAVRQYLESTARQPC
jgi:hypothetical protein